MIKAFALVFLAGIYTFIVYEIGYCAGYELNNEQGEEKNEKESD